MACSTMAIKNESVYPNCVLVARTIQVGGLTKPQLLQKFREGSISVKKLGEWLFADERFTTSNKVYALKTVELTVRDLEFLEGAVIGQIF